MKSLQLSVSCILLCNTSTFLGRADAFSPTNRRCPTRNVLFETSSTLEKDATTSATTTNQQEILSRQAQVEAHARSIHDNFAMNALFVNVEEHADPEACVVEQGRIPSDLPPGCLMRVGPNGASKQEGWLDGDGMVQCVVIPPANETPLFSATYVQTRGRTLEEEDRQVSGSTGKRFRGTLGAAPNGLPMLQSLVQNGVDFRTTVVQKDTCNTAMAVSWNRVLALMEQSPPSEVAISKDGRLRTLQSMCRLDGAVQNAPISGGSFGAHGRTDPKTGERVHVSYSSATKPFVRIDTFEENWKLTSSIGVETPAPVMIHDSAITENYVVVLDFPLTVRPRRFLRDGFPVEYEPNHGARIGLSLRREPAGGEPQTIWFPVEAGVTLHVANAWERPDGKVVLHGFKSIPKGESSYILDYTPAFLHEWILDPVSQTVVRDECLNPDELVEFPTVEDRDVAQDYQYIYGLQATTIGGPLLESKTPQVGVLLDGVVQFSVDDGSVVDRYTLEPGWHFCSEPTPVTKTSSEGAYLLLIATYVPEGSDRTGTHAELATDGVSLQSRLLILDTDDLSSGPVATLRLPHHVNYGLHSLYLPYEKLT